VVPDVPVPQWGLSAAGRTRPERALLLCHLLGVPIDHRCDQPGQGSWFRSDPGTGHVPHAWRRLDEASGPGRRGRGAAQRDVS
jgi:hypothetical protein